MNTIYKKTKRFGRGGGASRAHANALTCQLHGGLRQLEHHGHLVPARLASQFIAQDLLEVAVADAVYQVAHDRQVSHLLQAQARIADVIVILGYFVMRLMSNNCKFLKRT